MKLPTFKTAREQLQTALRAEGWTLSPSLNPQGKPYKVPFATSPSGDVRLWFKTEAIYVSNHGRFGSSLADARSLESDMRTLDPARFAVAAETLAKAYLRG